jgi:hypothetical protein
MKALRPRDVRRVVGVAGQALTAVLDTRHKIIDSAMLNSAGSVSAEWYIETLWHYLAKRSLLQGVSSIDLEFKQPARLADRQLHFGLPHPEADGLVMRFDVLRRTPGVKRPDRVPVALITVHRRQRRRRAGVAPDPPRHPYGIEVRRRHLNSQGRVSWHTLVAMCMDVARRGAQFDDPRIDRLDRNLLYIVPRFTFTPLGDAAAADNLFIYPEFSLAQPWTKGKTSSLARVTIWAVANEAPWPVAECMVTVVRTSLVDGVRRPVDESGGAVAKAVPALVAEARNTLAV